MSDDLGNLEKSQKERSTSSAAQDRELALQNMEARRRLEEKLEQTRLQKQIQDYDFDFDMD